MSPNIDSNSFTMERKYGIILHILYMALFSLLEEVSDYYALRLEKSALGLFDMHVKY